MTSYDPQTIMAGGIDEECARLEDQAALSWPDEARVYDTLGLREAVLLVEIGCGPGAITRRLRAWRTGGTTLAIDHDRRLLDRLGPANAVAGDARDLPLSDGCADALLMRYVLQHAPEPERLLAEARRVLCPGGRLVVVDVDAQLWGLVDPPIHGLDTVHHAMAAAQARQGGNRLIARRIPRLMTAAGFDDVTVAPFATTSTDRGVDAFEVHLGPQRVLPLVASGAVSMRELGLVTAGWQKFRADPDSWVLLLGLAVTGTVPART